jgi:hypothetical protein
MPVIARKSLQVAILAAGAFFTLSASTAQAQWAAIAIDRIGHWGYALGKPSRETAVEAATKGCGATGCKVEGAGKARCLAYVESRANGFWFGTGFGPSQGAAESTAMQGCNKGGAPKDTCKVIKAACQ